MVILQFNKLIRNKWLWGAFAIAISAFFAFDFLLADLQSNSRGGEEGPSRAGTLAGEAVNADLFAEIQRDIRGFGQNQDWKTPQDEINLQAWQNYAMITVADRNGIMATDSEVAALIRRDRSFQQNGEFSFQLYQRLLRENSLTPEGFEAMLKRRLTIQRVAQSVLGSAVWSSPMELDQAIADMTDVFTVKVARFSQTKEARDAVKLDDAGLKKWYDENASSLELPERMKIRYVKFNAEDKVLQAKLPVSESDLRDHYDVTVDKYTSTDTNGVETVKKFEEVKAEVEKEVRLIAAVQYFETNLNFRAYAVKAAEGASRLDEIAKEDGLKVETSDWFSADGGFREGFMRRAASILPGSQGFVEAVAELDPQSEDLRYAVVSSDKAVWLVEKAATSPKHVPTFDEAKAIIRPRALDAARADAFKAEVEKVIAKGADAVRAVKDISTNIVFNVTDLKSGDFPDQMAVARASMKLVKGGVSEFTPVGRGSAIVVVCEDRASGDAAKAMVLRSQVQNDVTMLQQRQIPEAWSKWNLERMGFTAGEINSVEKSEEAE